VDKINLDENINNDLSVLSIDHLIASHKLTNAYTFELHETLKNKNIDVLNRLKLNIESTLSYIERDQEYLEKIRKLIYETIEQET